MGRRGVRGKSAWRENDRADESFKGIRLVGPLQQSHDDRIRNEIAWVNESDEAWQV